MIQRGSFNYKDLVSFIDEIYKIANLEFVAKLLTFATLNSKLARTS